MPGNFRSCYVNVLSRQPAPPDIRREPATYGSPSAARSPSPLPPQGPSRTPPSSSKCLRRRFRYTSAAAAFACQRTRRPRPSLPLIRRQSGCHRTCYHSAVRVTSASRVFEPNGLCRGHVRRGRYTKYAILRRIYLLPLSPFLRIRP